MDRSPDRPAENPAELGPGQRRVRLGTQDLLQLVDALRNEGYSPAHLDLRGPTMEPLGEDVEELESELLGHLRHGELVEALTLLTGPGRGVYVVSVELRDRVAGGRVTLLRDGAVLLNNQQQRVKFLKALRQMWARVVDL